MSTAQKATVPCLCILGTGLAGGAVAASLEKAGVVLEDVVVKTGLSTTETDQQYSSVVIVCSSDISVDAKGLAEACKPLVPGGKVLLVQPSAQAPSKRALIMCGMKSVSIETLDIRGDVFALVQGLKPEVELGSKTAVRSSTTAGAWKIDVAGGEDEDLIDDDGLLTEEDRKPVVPKTDSGCATSKSACANCSCGRAEAEAQGVKLQLTEDMIENPKSACGSCGMGDAFRCATCPYRGLPSFEQGKKIQLPADFLMADA